MINKKFRGSLTWFSVFYLIYCFMLKISKKKEIIVHAIQILQDTHLLIRNLKFSEGISKIDVKMLLRDS